MRFLGVRIVHENSKSNMQGNHHQEAVRVSSSKYKRNVPNQISTSKENRVKPQKGGITPRWLIRLERIYNF
jgi:hypothetical protein